jgi:hypothetical protein
LSEHHDEPGAIGTPAGAETAGLRPESAGGAGMAEEGAPIGFTADVGGRPGMTDDPEELAELLTEPSPRGPMPSSERRERGEPDDSPPRVG